MARLADIVMLLKAAGEPTRLRILALMTEGELSVKDLTDILGQSQPRVSRHLKLLADAGLAVRHAEGAWAYYRLAESSDRRQLIKQLVAEIDPADPVISGDRGRLAELRTAQSQAAAAYFATVAESWDALRGLHVAEEAIEAAILEIVGRRRVERIVDFGTGTGRMLELLADHYTSGMGLDTSREMISVARSKLAAAGIGHAQIRLADIRDGIERPGTADLVMLHQVLHYFDDPADILTRAARALKPGGAVLVVDFAPHALEFLRAEHAHRRLGLSDEQMRAWGQTAGLSVAFSRRFEAPRDNGGLTVCLWLLEPLKPETTSKETS